MTELELQAWAGSFASFTARFTHLYRGLDINSYVCAIILGAA